jgi:putative ABC transport system permease protein
VLVLAGAIVAGQRRRIYDAVVLKVLGATRRDIALAFVLEYGLLGLVTAAIALAVGSLAAFLVLTEVMELKFTFIPVAATGSAGVALVVTLGFGLGATWWALGRKAAPLLRNE